MIDGSNKMMKAKTKPRNPKPLEAGNFNMSTNQNISEYSNKVP